MAPEGVALAPWRSMDRMLEVVDDRPPYVEMYCDAPLMCASLVNTRRAMASSSPTEQVCWSHGVHCTMDDIANSLGLFKVKVLSNDSQTCLFAISPDMPGRQQAEVMLTAAQQLRDVLSQVRLCWIGGSEPSICQDNLGCCCVTRVQCASLCCTAGACCATLVALATSPP